MWQTCSSCFKKHKMNTVDINTYEEIIEYILKNMQDDLGYVNPLNIDWKKFVLLSNTVHDSFIIPSTTITPIMRRFLFALGEFFNPKNIAGAGTYVGYGIIWLLGLPKDSRRKLKNLTCWDVDAEANLIAEKNLFLHNGITKKIITENAISGLLSQYAKLDLLYIDIDSPDHGKRNYIDVLKAAIPNLNQGSIIMAHDPCVKKFDNDFKLYHSFIESSGLFSNHWIFPIDYCGVSITIKK